MTNVPNKAPLAMAPHQEVASVEEKVEQVAAPVAVKQTDMKALDLILDSERNPSDWQITRLSEDLIEAYNPNSGRRVITTAANFKKFVRGN